MDRNATWAHIEFNKRWVALAIGATAGTLLPLLAARFSPMMALSIILGAVVASAAMYSPFIAVLLTSAVIPLERVGRFTNDDSAVTFSVMRIFGLLGLASLLVHAFAGRKRVHTALPVLLYAAYIFLSLLTLTHTTDFMNGFKWCSTMIGNLLFLLVVANSIRSSRQVRLPIVLWLATTLLIGGYTIYQWHFGTAVIQDDRFHNSGYRTTEDRLSTVILDYAELDTIGVVKRVLGATSHPAVYGINIILTIPFYVYLMVTTQSWWMRGFSVLGLAVGAYNVLLTNTRAAVIVLAFSLLLVFFSKLVKHRAAILLSTVVLGGAAMPFLPSAIYQRVLAAKNYSVGQSAALQIRFQYWGAGVDMFADHWLFGIGSGNQAELPRRLSNLRMPPNTSIHNEYIESLLETGVIGYPVIVGFMVVLFRMCLQVTQRARVLHNRDLEMFGVATLIAFITVLVYGAQCDVFHFTLKGWWLLMGLMIGIHGMRLPAPKESESVRSVPQPLLAREEVLA